MLQLCISGLANQRYKPEGVQLKIVGMAWLRVEVGDVM
jgi:hypothetical protein